MDDTVVVKIGEPVAGILTWMEKPKKHAVFNENI
jgi:hypothetical protein